MINFPLRFMPTNPVKHDNQSELIPKVRSFQKHVFLKKQKNNILPLQIFYFSLVSETLSKNILVKLKSLDILYFHYYAERQPIYVVYFFPFSSLIYLLSLLSGSQPLIKAQRIGVTSMISPCLSLL